MIAAKCMISARDGWGWGWGWEPVSGGVVGEELLELGLDALLHHRPAVLVAGEDRRRHRLHLLDRGVRRDRRDVRAGVDVEHRRPVGGEGGVPGGAEVVGLVDL